MLSITDEAVRYGLGQQDGPSVEYVPTNSGDSETTRTGLGTQTRLQMLDALLQDGRIKASDVPPELLAEDTEGGDRIRPLHEFPRSDGRELDRIAEGLIVEHGMEEVTDDYRDEYWDGYADVRDAYRAVDLDDYEKLEQGIRLTN
mgnify:CR=1 FL=1